MLIRVRGSCCLTVPIAISSHHSGLAYSGVVADGQRLIDIARVKAQQYRATYEERMPIRSVALGVSDEEINFSDQDYKVAILGGFI